MLPGPVLVILRVLSWLLAPHLALATVGSLFFDDRAARICCTLAVISVICALTLHTHDRVDARVERGFAAHDRAKDALVHALELVADDEPEGPPSRPLRAVRPGG